MDLCESNSRGKIFDFILANVIINDDIATYFTYKVCFYVNCYICEVDLVHIFIYRVMVMNKIRR